MPSVQSQSQALFDAPFTLQNALSSGISRKGLASMLLDRRVRRVLHGVYASATLTDTFDTRMAAHSRR